MEDATKKTGSRKPKSVFWKVYDFFSGFKLATATLILLLVLTWLATLEQVDSGLYPTLQKYFSWQAWYLIPELKGKKVPLVLPGGYWVCAVLLLNMTLGGIIRIRKGWRQAGNLISHFGIIFMLLGGGVAHHFSERGNMAVYEGETSDTAEDYQEYVVEVSEVKNGDEGEVRVIRGKHLTDLAAGKSRVFDFEGYPFDLEISGYLPNTEPLSELVSAPSEDQRVTDGYFLMERRPDKEVERNVAGAYARVVYESGEKSPPFIVSGLAYYPFTIRVDDRVFVVNMRKRLWPMPFRVELDKFTADFHPGTGRPAKFVSDITRVENGQDSELTIRMNEPMRYEGLTFFQASYGPPDARPGDKMYSVFEVVKNPADKWPEYSLYVVAFGMLVTFLTKLGGHLGASFRKRKHES
ncbi:MAG: cytochrome c biogenesis protein ResB [Luteolibacter sp.]